MTKQYTESTLYEEHKEHLKGKPLEIDCTINKNQIEVISDSTIFIKIYRKKHIDETDFIDVIKKVKKESKKNGTKLTGINKLQQYISENYSDYNTTFMKYDKKFDVLALLWEQNVDYLNYGCRDNAIYNEVLLEKKFELERIQSFSIIRKFERYYHQLLKLLIDLELENNLKTVAVF